MQFSTDERHAETLAFLAEVREYMARWGLSPVNRAMLNRVDAHLAQPSHRLIAQAETRRSGGAYSAVGLCFLQARLDGDMLTVSLPTNGSAMPDDQVLTALRDGLSFRLKAAST